MKRTTTKFLELFACLAMIFAMTACGGGASSSVSQAPSSSAPAASSSEPDSSSVADSSLPDSSMSMADSSAPAGGAGSSANLADDWNSFQLLLDGVVYTFPTTFSEFEANGWEIDAGAAGSALAGNSLTSVDYSKGEAKFSFNAINNDATSKPIEECVCFGVYITNLKLKGMELALPGGLTMGATPDEIIAAYGEPTEKNINAQDILRSFTYGDATQNIELSFTEDGIMDSVRYTVRP